MTDVRGEVHESSAEIRVESLPMAHVSIELGHLYHEDLEAGQDGLCEVFRSVAPWAAAAVNAARTRGRPAGSVRASTCFLIDDYFSPFSTPAEIVPMLLTAAEEAGLTIDYLARESSCADDGVSRPAALALGRLVREPVEGDTGSRPPVGQTGWLSNGERSPVQGMEAMSATRAWRPPRQSAARRHSIFMDVELWDEQDGEQTWSCAMLAAVWQLQRLGLLRDHGRPVAQARDHAGPWPSRWAEMPAITRLNPSAAAFTAYSTVSLLSPRFLPVEGAVRTILSQFAAEPAVLSQVAERALGEGLALSEEIVDRLHYAFVGPGSTDPA